MQALAKFAAIVHGGKLDLKVDVSVPELAHQFIVNNENTLVLQRIQVGFRITCLYLKCKFERFGGYVFMDALFFICYMKN